MTSDSSPSISTPEQIDLKQRLAHWRLIVAGWFVVAWLIALGTLSVLTANPVTLNRGQVAESVVVVTAIVEDAKAGKVHVRKVWKNPAWNAEELVLSNLQETGAANGQLLLIPVSATGVDSYAVTRSKLPKHPPLVYPASPEAERQLQSLLKDDRLP